MVGSYKMIIAFKLDLKKKKTDIVSFSDMHLSTEKQLTDKQSNCKCLLKESFVQAWGSRCRGRHNLLTNFTYLLT